MDSNDILGNYWSLVHRRASQEMSKTRFGSEMEAQSGGSSATFRYSDSPDYVSKILASSPVNFVSRYPDQINQMREEVGLDPIPTADDAGYGIQDYFPGYGIQDYALGDGTFQGLFGDPKKLALIALAVVLVLGGLIVMALSTDTGKALAKDAVKAAAA